MNVLHKFGLNKNIYKMLLVYLINIYVIVSFGVRISEVVYEAQKKIKYVLENTLQQELGAVNVFVQGVAKKD